MRIGRHQVIEVTLLDRQQIGFPDRSDGRRAAKELSLPLTREVFSLSPREMEKVYYARFEAICDEIRAAEPHL